MYNEFVKSYEVLKNYKVALPLGKQPGQTEVSPELVEAYYSGTSLKMVKAHVDAIEKIWYGKDKQDQDGLGFDDYLSQVTGGTALVASTKAQLAAIHAALENIPETPRFSEQLESNYNAVDALNTELQKTTRYFKTDMSSLLGIAITFSSNDGD